MTTIGTEDGRNYARVNLKLVDRERAQALAEGDRGRDPRGAEADSRHRARVRLRPADLGQPARPRSGHADDADQRVRGEGRQGPGHRRPRDLGEGGHARAVDPPQQRCRRRPRHHRAAGRVDGAPAARRRHGQLLARRPTARTTRSTCSCRRTTGAARLRPGQPLPDDRTSVDPTARCGWCRCGRSPRLVETTSPQIIKRQDLQRRVALYANVEGPARPATSAPTCRRS